MKTLFLIAVLMFSSSAYAVDITITLTAAQATRAAAACGKTLGLVDGNQVPRSCTMAEAKAFLIDYLRHIVFDAERQQAQSLITNSAFDPL